MFDSNIVLGSVRGGVQGLTDRQGKIYNYALLPKMVWGQKMVYNHHKVRSTYLTDVFVEHEDTVVELELILPFTV